MATLVAERPEGPFAAAKKNLHVLAGHTYFARFLPTPEGLLVNHHSIARNGQVSFGTLKAAQLDDEGTLRLRWWAGNEQLCAAARIPGKTNGLKTVWATQGGGRGVKAGRKRDGFSSGVRSDPSSGSFCPR